MRTCAGSPLTVDVVYDVLQLLEEVALEGIEDGVVISLQLLRRRIWVVRRLGDVDTCTIHRQTRVAKSALDAFANKHRQQDSRREQCPAHAALHSATFLQELLELL